MRRLLASLLVAGRHGPGRPRQSGSLAAQRSFLGYRNQGQRPIETINLFRNH